MMHYCSIVNEQYIERALALWRSLQTHCYPFCWWVMALDQTTLDTLEPLANAVVIPFGSYSTRGISITPALEEARTRLQENVFIWACKPTWLLYLLNIVQMTQLIYVDSDCYFFNSPETMYQEIGDVPIALTPHRFSPKQGHFVVNGRFNGGFIYLCNQPYVQSCLKQWSTICIKHQNGRHTEQRHLDTWPINYGAYPIEHKGVNLAPWNQADQYVYTLRDGQIYVDDDPLVFYHFHQRLTPAYPIDPFVQTHIYDKYRQELQSKGGT